MMFACCVFCCVVWCVGVCCHRAHSLTLTPTFHSFHTHSFTPRHRHLQSLLEPLDVDGYRNLDPAHTSPEELENGRGEWPSTVNMYNDVLPNPRTRVKLAVRHHFPSPRVAFSLYYIIRSFLLLFFPCFSVLSLHFFISPSCHHFYYSFTSFLSFFITTRHLFSLSLLSLLSFSSFLSFSHSPSAHLHSLHQTHSNPLSVISMLSPPLF